MFAPLQAVALIAGAYIPGNYGARKHYADQKQVVSLREIETPSPTIRESKYDRERIHKACRKRVVREGKKEYQVAHSEAMRHPHHSLDTILNSKSY